MTLNFGLAGREFLQLFEERFSYRIVLTHEIVIKLDRALNLVRVKPLDSSSRQLQCKREKYVAQMSFAPH